MFRRWAGALVAIAATTVLVLAGCADGGDTTAPTVSGVEFTTTTTTATITATVNKAGKFFWVAYDDGADKPADAAALIADAGKAKATPIVANSGTAGHTVSAAGTVSVEITGLAENTSYDLYAVAQDTAGNSSVLSAKVAVRTTNTTAPAVVTSITATGFGATGVRLIWTNPDPTTDDLKQISLQWAAIGSPDRIVGGGAVNNPTEGGQSIHTVSDLTVGTIYRFSLIAIDTADNRSTAATVDGGPLIDRDNDTLIDILNLDMLNNVRYGLAGTFYADTAAATSGLQCGTTGTTACTGYELTRGNLDFATAASYASGSINNAWQPTNASGTVVAPASAINAGFPPIGGVFSGIFDGNGNSISNLYVRTGNAGLFKQLSGTVRSLGVVSGNVYTTSTNGYAGIIVVQINTGGTVVASYATGSVTGAGGGDITGGLVGYNIGGTIIASYATVSTDGSDGFGNFVGGLVGRMSNGAIVASYATGDANSGSGAADRVGSLVGNTSTNSTVVASYATGNANSGGGMIDNTSNFSGNTGGTQTITAGYGFGTATGGGAGPAGSTKPTAVTASGVAGARQLNAPGTTTPANTAVPATWNAAANNTLGAWDFGSSSQIPALRYADYDGAGTTYDCSHFPPNACGTLIPGQR